MATFIFFLFLAAAGLLFHAVYLRGSATSLRHRLGVPAGEIRYVDSARVLKPKVLYSEKYQLKGKPDMIVLENEQFIPVEYKPSAARVYPGYVMQLIAYCALVEEVYGRTPSHGILVLKDGKKEKIDFTEQKRQELFAVLGKMRGMLNEGAPSQDFTGMNKCKTCSYGTLCGELVDLSGGARYYT